MFNLVKASSLGSLDVSSSHVLDLSLSQVLDVSLGQVLDCSKQLSRLAKRFYVIAGRFRITNVSQHEDEANKEAFVSARLPKGPFSTLYGRRLLRK